MRLRFGEFEFNSETEELWQGGTAIRLQPQPARVLAFLIAQPGELITREALQHHVWGGDTVVVTVLVLPFDNLSVEKGGPPNGLGTSYQDVSGVYDTVLIGPFTFRHVWGPAGAVPIIGMEMMRRFTLTFDTKRGLLYLEPNASFHEPVPAPS